MSNKSGKNGKEPGKHKMKFVEPAPTATEASGMTRQYCMGCGKTTPHKQGVCVWSALH